MLGTDTRSQGPTPALFVRTAAFEAIVKEQIRQLEGPGLHCFQPVHGELIPGQLLTKIQVFHRHPALLEYFNSVVVHFLKAPDR